MLNSITNKKLHTLHIYALEYKWAKQKLGQAFSFCLFFGAFLVSLFLFLFPWFVSFIHSSLVVPLFRCTLTLLLLSLLPCFTTSLLHCSFLSSSIATPLLHCTLASLLCTWLLSLFRLVFPLFFFANVGVNSTSFLKISTFLFLFWFLGLLVSF